MRRIHYRMCVSHLEWDSVYILNIKILLIHSHSLCFCNQKKVNELKNEKRKKNLSSIKNVCVYTKSIKENLINILIINIADNNNNKFVSFGRRISWMLYINIQERRREKENQMFKESNGFI